MADTIFAGWQRRPSDAYIYTGHASETTSKEEQFAAPLHPLWAGISTAVQEAGSVDVAIAIHDGIYLQDFSVKSISKGNKDAPSELIADHVISELKSYEHSYLAKFIGAGLPEPLRVVSPKLSSRLWLELDIVPISIPVNIVYTNGSEIQPAAFWGSKSVDEQADSMARRCIVAFGPKLSPILQVGYGGAVGVDCGSRVHLVSLDDYRKTCSPQTWDAMMTFVNSLRKGNKKIAFFSSTPQGGGVALMRHALVRLANLLGVNLKWYVPKPKPGVFRITKTVHNTLQGVSNPNRMITRKEKDALNEWIEENARRYWLHKGGPLRPPSEGGADIIIVDDPQMPRLISLVKHITPDRPVIFRSHIQIRSDLINEDGTPQADIWEFLWENIKQADLFISHPIPSFVPKNIPETMVAYMPATTDWLDGLNKAINPWDQSYYMNLYNQECATSIMTKLTSGKYIIQISRFDPAKGIDDVLKSYAAFARLIETHDGEKPQLVIAGNSSIDDPEGSKIYDETVTTLQTTYPHLVPYVSVMRLNSNDQLLNSLLSAAHIVLQLSTREGFEVKVSEAIHKGIPVIATRAGGIPLQVQDKKNGFLVQPGDWKAVAEHMYELWMDDQLYNKMSKFAKGSVSDEVGTVGNALAWFYLADTLGRGNKIKVESGHKWVNDMARKASNTPYDEGENMLPRFI